MTLSYPTSSLAAHPPRLSPAYRSTVKRSPQKPLIIMRHTLSELTGPVYGHETVRENDNDLTLQCKGEPLGERIIVHGHVLDGEIVIVLAHRLVAIDRPGQFRQRVAHDDQRLLRRSLDRAAVAWRQPRRLLRVAGDGVDECHG